MTATDVRRVAGALGAAGVGFWLDGGWGVDALLGAQTRPHGDLDLVIALDRAEVVIAALSQLEFAVASDERPTRLVLEGRDGRSVDLHTVAFDAEGSGIQALPGGRAYRYPPEGFRARGTIGGRELPCLTPEVQLECHVGYPPEAKDHHDVLLLVRLFGLKPPPPYAHDAP
jgi:lincosamide nucleotidyltransferase A/C/D/E